MSGAMFEKYYVCMQAGCPKCDRADPVGHFLTVEIARSVDLHIIDLDSRGGDGSMRLCIDDTAWDALLWILDMMDTQHKIEILKAQLANTSYDSENRLQELSEKLEEAEELLQSLIRTGT
jgi:hypothetical protein